MKKVVVNGITISYNLESILKELNSVDFDEEYYTAHGECGGVNEDGIREEYCVTWEEFELLKKKAIRYVKSLTDKKVTNLAKNALRINKTGKLHATARNMAYDMGNVNNYDDSYGSHTYETTVLVFSRTGDYDATLKVDHYFKHQSSF